MQRLLLIFLYWVISSFALAGQAKTLTLASGDWPPLISSHMSDEGYISQVVRESFENAGIEVQITYRPWKRAMNEVSQGVVDAGFAWRKTPDRELSLVFSDEIYEGLNVFFHLKSTRFQWLTYLDLSAYRLGGALGYIYGKGFEGADKSGLINVYRVANENSLIGMLLAHRIDAFPGNKEVVSHLIKTQFPGQQDQITYDPLPVSNKPLYLVAKPTPEGREIIKQFNVGLAKLKASGRYHEIYKGLSE